MIDTPNYGRGVVRGNLSQPQLIIHIVSLVFIDYQTFNIWNYERRIAFPELVGQWFPLTGEYDSELVVHLCYWRCTDVSLSKIVVEIVTIEGIYVAALDDLIGTPICERTRRRFQVNHLFNAFESKFAAEKTMIIMKMKMEIISPDSFYLHFTNSQQSKAMLTFRWYGESNGYYSEISRFSD